VQVKSALTRLYNQGGHRAQALVHAQVQAQGVKKKRGGKVHMEHEREETTPRAKPPNCRVTAGDGHRSRTDS
jgi:hypothetical protein